MRLCSWITNVVHENPIRVAREPWRAAVLSWAGRELAVLHRRVDVVVAGTCETVGVALVRHRGRQLTKAHVGTCPGPEWPPTATERRGAPALYPLPWHTTS